MGIRWDSPRVYSDIVEDARRREWEAEEEVIARDCAEDAARLAAREPVDGEAIEGGGGYDAHWRDLFDGVWR